MTLLDQAQLALDRDDKPLARRLLADLIVLEPKNEVAWMWLARVALKPEQSVECYERVLKLNPANVAAKKELVRLKFPGETFDPQRGIVPENPYRLSPQMRGMTNIAAIGLVVLLLLGTASLAFANKDVQDAVQKVIAANPTAVAQQVQDLTTARIAAGDVDAQPQAPQAQVQIVSQPRSTPLPPFVDALVQLAVVSAAGGSEGAPALPGAPITPVLADGQATRDLLESSVPPPGGGAASVTLTEAQLTSWVAYEMEDSSELPFRNVQVYLRNGQVLMWGIIQGDSAATSGLVVLTPSLTPQGGVAFTINSAQFGKISVPGVLLDQAVAWLNQRANEEISQNAAGLVFTSVTIADGQATLTGQR